MRTEVKVSFGDNATEAFKFMDYFFDRVSAVEFLSADDALRASSVAGTFVKAGWNVTLERPVMPRAAPSPSAVSASFIDNIVSGAGSTDQADPTMPRFAQYNLQAGGNNSRGAATSAPN